MTSASACSWTTVQLHEVCRPKQWQTIKKSDMTETGFAVYGANGVIGRYHSFNHSDPTILIGCRGTCGAVTVSEPFAWVTGNAMALDELDTSIVDARYLVHALVADGLGDAVTGTSQPQITQTSLKRIYLPLPPLQEQRQIAAVLDAAEALRAKRREALAKLDELIQSIFVDMFGDATAKSAWPKARLAEVCHSKGEYGANVPAVEFDSGKPRYLRITDIRSDGTLTDDAVGPGGAEDQWRSKILNRGDIVFARSGATVGKTFLVRDEITPLVFAGYLIRFVPDQHRILPEFLYRCTRTEQYRSWVTGAATTVAQPNVNASKYADLELSLPPMELQRRFVGAVEGIQRHRAKLEASAASLDELFASLQQRAFRREL